MIRTFDELIREAAARGPRTIAVAAAQDGDVLRSVEKARALRLADAVLVGDRPEIERLAAECGIDTANFTLIDVRDPDEACLAAVDMVRRGKAGLLMKGFVETSVILKAVLDRDRGLRAGKLLSHVGVLEVKGFGRLFLVSDSAMTVAPTLLDKVDIINNSVRVAHALGIDLPKVALLCAVEKVSEKMPATGDAAALTKMNEAGEIRGCMVKGPLALDNAVSEEAARHKGIVHPVAGRADILIAPDIEAGNILNKAMEYFAGAEKAGVIMGAKTPVILTSRASSERSKLHSIALGLLIADRER